MLYEDWAEMVANNEKSVAALRSVVERDPSLRSFLDVREKILAEQKDPSRRSRMGIYGLSPDATLREEMAAFVDIMGRKFLCKAQSKFARVR